MLNSCSTRVAIVDDTVDEALPLVRLLSSKGVGVAYYNGKRGVGGAPETPLKGVRFLFLDLGLAGEGKPNVNATAGVVKKIIAPDNGPYVLVVWSQHPEEARDFSALIVKYSGSEYDPVRCIVISKVSVKDDAGDYSYEKIMDALVVGTEGLVPLLYFLDWESTILWSAQSIVHEIFSEARSHAKENDYLTEIARAISAFYCAEIGGRVGSIPVVDKDVYLAASSCMSSVFNDVFDRSSLAQAESLSVGLADCCKEFVQKRPMPKTPLLGKLASYLLASQGGGGG